MAHEPVPSFAMLAERLTERVSWLEDGIRKRDVWACPHCGMILRTDRAHRKHIDDCENWPGHSSIFTSVQEVVTKTTTTDNET